jgi:hypothetical protein
LVVATDLDVGRRAGHHRLEHLVAGHEVLLVGDWVGALHHESEQSGVDVGCGQKREGHCVDTGDRDDVATR